MAKAVILKTDKGVMIMGAIQSSNGAWFNADGCYKYCQEETPWKSAHQSHKLIHNSSLIGKETTSDDWYLHRENFVDIEIPFTCTQKYINEYRKVM